MPEAILYKIYMVYRDFITMLIIEVLSFTITLISTFSGAFVSETVMLAWGYFVQDLHGLHRFYHNVDHSGIKLFHHTNFHI